MFDLLQVLLEQSRRRLWIFEEELLDELEIQCFVVDAIGELLVELDRDLLEVDPFGQGADGEAAE